MRTFALLLALAVLGTACAATASDDPAAADESAVTSGAVTASVRDRLRVSNPRDEGRLWAISEGNLLHDNWLLQIPSKETWGQSALGPPIPCDGWSGCNADFKLATCAVDGDCGPIGKCVELEAAGGKVCGGHSDKAILDEIYGVMTRTNAYLDVTSLQAPTGKFLATMRHALTVLDGKGTKITVRFLFGDYPGYTPRLPQILADLTRDVRAGSKLDVSVAAHRRSPSSWNHSKIIAADGREAIVGGMNLWDAHYLEAEPVRDVSTHIRGPAAMAAQRYVNEVWATPCGNGHILNGRGQNTCPPSFQPTVAPAPLGSTRMITIGRTGAAFDNPSDTALVAMMDAARSTIRITQQDIGSVKVLGGVMPMDYLDAWTRAARRGVDVTIVTSNEGSYGGKGESDSDSYFNGWSLEDLWRGLIARADKQWPDSHKQLCKHVHFARMRQSPSPTWASGRPLANHAKVVIVDDQAHYIGSQNLYDANLAEFGVIVDDQTATRQLVADYWSKLAQFSTPTSYVDRECH